MTLIYPGGRTQFELLQADTLKAVRFRQPTIRALAEDGGSRPGGEGGVPPRAGAPGFRLVPYHMIAHSRGYGVFILYAFGVSKQCAKILIRRWTAMKEFRSLTATLQCVVSFSFQCVGTFILADHA